ncbi:glycosyltransferase family A protein [Bariatricus sp. HCP28S3_D3]|uniref:glycosyltransferase family A protein n=1 Tax=Bariatricus sp. HCP28S3_D3 TaxID=3438901 RepID=UPI003F8CA969
MESLVSIVTPCYNGEFFVGRFMESVLNQTYSNLELILINDGSTDQTEEVVHTYQKRLEQRGIRFVYQCQKNAGQAAALNKGLKLFKGEYLTWLDSDDEIMPEFIEKKVKFLQRNPEYVYCYGKAIVVNEDAPEKIVDIYEKRKRTGRYAYFEDILFSKNVFFSGYMVKTSAFDAVIPNREIYCGRGGQNAQILLPLSWYYGNPGYVEDSVYKYYIRRDSHSHSQNTSEKIIRQLHNYEQILIFTLQQIPEREVRKYICIVRKHFARLRFGNAVDTKNSELIKKYFYELIQVRELKVHDFALYVKYSNKVVRKLFHVEG